VSVLKVLSTKEVFGKFDEDLREWYEIKVKGCTSASYVEDRFELRSDGKVWLKDNWSKGK
jgi:hypothetical protein